MLTAPRVKDEPCCMEVVDTTCCVRDSTNFRSHGLVILPPYTPYRKSTVKKQMKSVGSDCFRRSRIFYCIFEFKEMETSIVL